MATFSKTTHLQEAVAGYLELLAVRLRAGQVSVAGVDHTIETVGVVEPEGAIKHQLSGRREIRLNVVDLELAAALDERRGNGCRVVPIADLSYPFEFWPPSTDPFSPRDEDDDEA